jgi:hypothetical protein
MVTTLNKKSEKAFREKPDEWLEAKAFQAAYAQGS